MFDKLNVPIFGVIENMSYFACPHCGERTDIFGHGGARQAADDLGLEFLGELPLDPATRVAADAGEPIVARAPESAQAQAFIAVARQVAARCSVLEFAAEHTNLVRFFGKTAGHGRPPPEAHERCRPGRRRGEADGAARTTARRPTRLGG
jgi:hypothetical protein